MAVARIPSAATCGVRDMAKSQRAKLKDLKELIALGSCICLFVFVEVFVKVYVNVIVGGSGLKK